MSWIAFIETISFQPILPLWILTLLLVLFAGLLIWQHRQFKSHLSTRQARVLLWLRGASLALLFFFALNPSVLISRVENLKPKLAILIDTSQSMTIKGPDKKSRLERAKEILIQGEVPLLERLAEKYDVSLYAFAEGLRPLDVNELPALAARGKGSDLFSALLRISEPGRPTRPDDVLILSDGNIRWNVEAEALLSQLNIPLWTVSLATLEGYQDIAITEVRAPELAFLDKPVKIDFTIKGYGFGGTKVGVFLKKDEKLLARTTALIDQNLFRGTFSLSFIPHEQGDYQLSIAIPVQPGERLSANNTANALVNVLRDKIRVLMVTGSPSFGYRFLRAALKGDPTIDLLSFVILRSPTDIMNVPMSEQALIPFPVETLFSKDLNSFDLLIFDNFSYVSYFATPYLENIKKFVEEGGAFAMLGGDKAFGDGKYRGTPVEEILPLGFPSPPSYQAGPLDSFRLTQAGRVHILSRLIPDREENIRLWADLPAIDGYNQLDPTGRGTVLVDAGSAIPILAVANVGRGRTLALATDYAWKWYMGRVARGQSNQPYLRLMTRMVRWLVRNPGLSMVEIERPRPAGLNQETQVRINVRQESDPEALALSAWVTDPDGLKTPLELHLAAPGQYVTRFVPHKQGTYSLKVEARSEGRLLDERETKVVISSASGEFIDPAPDPELLIKLAHLSGGSFADNGHKLNALIDVNRKTTKARLIEQRRLPLWGTAFALTVVLTILFLEWFLRRRWGLI